MAEHPLKVFMENDPELMDLLKQTEELELSDGALPKKMKLLIALALDASRGAVGGVHALAREALEAGATKEEILETVRVAHFVCGVGSVYVAAQGLRDVL
jgi:alkylhydroperoxidase/carboxymuconolactone decarboxylase family protein YurZ